MPHVTFVYPCIGRFPSTEYVRSWQMQPLSIAVLAALTPDNWDRTLFDDRMEDIDYDVRTDLVAISIETYNARRGYQIARRFRKRGIAVVMGGFHATFCPDEVLEFADAVCIGPAEGVWWKILADTMDGRLNGKYVSSGTGEISIKTDRSIFGDKRYLDIDLVETGRGCKFECDFCSISAFYRATYRRRPTDEIIAELKQLKSEVVFFVDDNIVADFAAAKLLFRAMIPLKIKWISQATVNVVKDKELLDLMVQSGCAGVLIGFESLEEKNLVLMNKSVNAVSGYGRSLKTLRRAGIRIYGTFVFGYEHDTERLIRKTKDFAIEHKMFLAAFNHLVPFPATPLYDKIEKDGRLLYDKWWLSETYRFGQLVFEPAGRFSASDIQQKCMKLRRDFYNIVSITKRAFDFDANFKDLKSGRTFLIFNFLLRFEIDKKFGLPLGLIEED